MGSLDRACISGFLCRLCSEMHRIVIHIYGDQGKRLGLVEKINGYLPITISPTDPLPKTICQSCLHRVEQHYDLLLRLSRIKEGRFLRIYKQRTLLRRDNTESEYFTEEELQRSNINGPFIIASSVSNSPNHVHQYSDDQETDDEAEDREIAPTLDGNGNDNVMHELELTTQNNEEHPSTIHTTTTAMETSSFSSDPSPSAVAELEQVIEDGVVDMFNIIND